VGVNLTWQDTPDETYYQVCAGLSLGACTFADVTTTANTTSYALTGLDYGTTYFWQVSACNAGGCTPANNGIAWSFSTQNPPVPGPFQKTTPANGALNVPTNTALVLLQWTASANADGYEVCLGTNPGTCDLSGGGFQDVGLVTSRLVSQLPFSVTLQPASTYYWQVRAYNNVTATRTFADGGVDFHFTTACGQRARRLQQGRAAQWGVQPADGDAGPALVPGERGDELRGVRRDGGQQLQCHAGEHLAERGERAGLHTDEPATVGTTYHWQVRAINSRRDDRGERRGVVGVHHAQRAAAAGVHQGRAAAPGDGCADGDGRLELVCEHGSERLRGMHRQRAWAVRGQRRLGEHRERHAMGYPPCPSGGDDLLVAGARAGQRAAGAGGRRAVVGVHNSERSAAGA
jgi:hypothetical protein